jgi:hypothetical protein
MRDYEVEIAAMGMGLPWLAETVVRALDAAVQEGRASKVEATNLPLRFYATEDGKRDLNLTPSETTQLRAVFERRTGEAFYFRTEREEGIGDS